MVLTRAQLSELPVEDLIEYAVKLGDLRSSYEELEKRHIELIESNIKLKKKSIITGTR